MRSLFVLRLHARATLRARVLPLALPAGGRAEQRVAVNEENRCGGGKRNLSRVLSDVNIASTPTLSWISPPFDFPQEESASLKCSFAVQCVTDKLQCSVSLHQ